MKKSLQKSNELLKNQTMSDEEKKILKKEKSKQRKKENLLKKKEKMEEEKKKIEEMENVLIDYLFLDITIVHNSLQLNIFCKIQNNLSAFFQYLYFSIQIKFFL